MCLSIGHQSLSLFHVFLLFFWWQDVISGSFWVFSIELVPINPIDCNLFLLWQLLQQWLFNWLLAWSSDISVIFNVSFIWFNFNFFNDRFLLLLFLWLLWNDLSIIFRLNDSFKFHLHFHLHFFFSHIWLFLGLRLNLAWRCFRDFLCSVDKRVGNHTTYRWLSKFRSTRLNLLRFLLCFHLNLIRFFLDTHFPHGLFVLLRWFICELNDLAHLLPVVADNLWLFLAGWVELIHLILITFICSFGNHLITKLVLLLLLCEWKGHLWFEIGHFFRELFNPEGWQC